METRVLKYFLAVAREENITKAAEQLHITQPTLSRQLAQLEEELGVHLFERGTRRTTLTSEGLLLRRRAEEIVDLVGRTEAELRVSAETLTGEVRIGCGETPAVRLIANVIAEMQDDYPLVRFALHSGKPFMTFVEGDSTKDSRLRALLKRVGAERHAVPVPIPDDFQVNDLADFAPPPETYSLALQAFADESLAWLRRAIEG